MNAGYHRGHQGNGKRVQLDGNRRNELGAEAEALAFLEVHLLPDFLLLLFTEIIFPKLRAYLRP